MRKLTRLKSRIYVDCQDFAFHDYPELRRDYTIQEAYFNSRFSKANQIEFGARIAYVIRGGIIVHFGLCTNRGTVVSKDGWNSRIFEHSVHDHEWGKSRPVLYNVPFLSRFDEDVRRFLLG